MRKFHRFGNLIAGQPLRAQVYQQQMRIGAAGNQIQTAFFQSFAHCFGIADHLRGIFLKLRRQVFGKTNRLGGNHMLQRTALRSRKNRRVDFLGNFLVIGQNHAAARAAQSLVRGRRNHVGIFQRIRMYAAGNQTGKMRHVHHQIRPDFVGNFAETLKINLPRISRTAGNNQFRLIFQSQPLNFVIINQPGVSANPVLNRIKPFAGKGNL